MAINTNPTFAFGQDLTPEQLRSMHALRGDHATQLQNIDTFGLLTESSDPYQAQIGTVGRTWDLRPGDSFSPSLTYNPGTAYTGSGESLFSSPTPDGSYIIGQAANKSTWGNSDQTGQWDADTGKWLGYSTGGTALRDFANWAATSLAAYYTMGQTPDGGGAVSGMDMAADNPSMWNVGDISAGGGTGGAVSGMDMAADNPSMWNTGNTAGTTTGTTPTGGGMWDAAKAAGSTLVDSLGGAKGTGALLGAAAGALSSKDQTQTSTRDPWSAAQPFLKQQLQQGSDLSNKYAAQPFSAAQQTAYGNVGGLLDMINGNAGGLMANAGAVGQNQFRRGMYQPTQFQSIGAPAQYGLLGNFGTKG